MQSIDSGTCHLAAEGALAEWASSPDLLGLQQAVQEGALESPPWISLARAMRRYFAALSVNFFFIRDEDDEINITEAIDFESRPADHLQRYRDNYRQFDTLPYFSMEPGRVYRFEELLGDLSTNVFYQEFLRPVGNEELIICHVQEPNGYRGWIAVGRRTEAGVFSADEIKVCEWIARQWRSALTVFGRLKQLEVERNIYANGMRRLHMGYLLLDQRGQLIRMDDKAADLLSRDGNLYLKKGRINIRHPEKNRELQAIIADGLQCRTCNFSRALNANSTQFTGMLICSAPASPMYASDADPHLVIYINEPEISEVAAEERIAELFDLSQTEAALAAQLVRGRTLTEAAASLNLTEYTARNYSKRIFCKTGTHRQAELVRLILTSVASVA